MSESGIFTRKTGLSKHLQNIEFQAKNDMSLIVGIVKNVILVTGYLVTKLIPDKKNIYIQFKSFKFTLNFYLRKQ